MSLRKFLLAMLLCAPVLDASAQNADDGTGNPLLYALAWKQTAAEYQALYHQGFNIARLHVEAALAARQSGDKPLAVISDVDDTVLHSLTYWGHLVRENMDFFDDADWDRWVAANLATATPGAMEFLQFCRANNVEVFYVTNRDQGDNTFALALQHLRTAGLPFADEAHVTVLRETSNKEPRQDELMAQYDVVVMLGDSLNDFRRKYYVRGDIDGRIAAMAEDSAKFGVDYVIFPNPTDGHWLAGIYGDSEPPATQANRLILKDAASRQTWDDPLAQARRAYYEGDFATALAIWRPLAEQGVAKAQNNLGILYRNGEGLIQDFNEARRWLQTAAAQGHARALFSLGMMYDFGQGVAQNTPQALIWYQQAAAQGDADAQFNIGTLYSEGRGIAQDASEAARWYQQAAEQGHANAQAVLGRLYLAGEGVSQDREEARRWLELAAAQGHTDAQEQLEQL
jgi:5'-nucleotidase (lipoprotein e(P4) family)